MALLVPLALLSTQAGPSQAQPSQAAWEQLYWLAMLEANVTWHLWATGHKGDIDVSNPAWLASIKVGKHNCSCWYFCLLRPGSLHHPPEATLNQAAAAKHYTGWTGLLTLPGTSGQQATKVTLMSAVPWPTSIVDGRQPDPWPPLALLALLFAEAAPDLDVSQ